MYWEHLRMVPEERAQRIYQIHSKARPGAGSRVTESSLPYGPKTRPAERFVVWIVVRIQRQVRVGNPVLHTSSCVMARVCGPVYTVQS